MVNFFMQSYFSELGMNKPHVSKNKTEVTSQKFSHQILIRFQVKYHLCSIL